MMFCTNCGKQLPDGTLQCPDCNTDLASVLDPEVNACETPSVTEYEQTPAAEEQVTDISAEPEMDSAEDIDAVTETQEAEPTETETAPTESCKCEDRDFAPDAPACPPAEEEPQKDTGLVSAPPAAETAEQTESAVASKPKRSVKNIIVTSISHTFAVIVSVILGAALLCASFYTVFRVTFSERSLERMIESVVAAELDVTDLIPEQQKKDMGLEGDDINLVDLVYENITQSSFTCTFTKSELADLIDTIDFSEYFADKIGEYLEDLKHGNSDVITLIDSDDAVELLKDNRSEIKKVLGYSLTSQDYDTVREFIEEKQREDKNFGKIDISETTTREFVDGLSVLFSTWILVAIWLVCLLLALLIFLIRFNLKGGFNYCGTTAIVVGVLVMLVSLAMIIDFVSPIFDSGVEKIVARAISVVGVNTLIVGGCVLGAGIAFVLTAYIIKLVQRKKAKKTAAAPAQTQNALA